MIKIYLQEQNNKLLKLAESINDNTIPNDICIS